MRFSLLLILSGIVLSVAWYGCKKDLTEEIHIDTTISDNDPPPYNGISDVQIINYINKLYIDLLGRAPSDEEISERLTYLESHNLSDGSRDSVIQDLMDTKAFYNRLFDLSSADFINSVDSGDIAYEIDLINLIALLDSINGNIQNLIYYHYEVNRLVALQHVTDDYQEGIITVNDYYAVFLNNYFYDQVNMGSENFVKGAFDDLFRRAPTQSELNSGVIMVDNVPSILFLQNGDSKGDFISIVTNCDEFYEGLVLKTYQQLLLRSPSSGEMSQGTAELQSTKNFPALQKKLLKTSEYAGF